MRRSLDFVARSMLFSIAMEALTISESELQAKQCDDDMEGAVRIKAIAEINERREIAQELLDSL